MEDIERGDIHMGVIFGNRWKHLVGNREFWEHIRFSQLRPPLPPSSTTRSRRQTSPLMSPGPRDVLSAAHVPDPAVPDLRRSSPTLKTATTDRN
ncbi:hypothetical protein AKJ16_DCAP17280 [Drosera capensis]